MKWLMTSDVVMLGLIAIADIYLLVYLRRRRTRRVRMEQMTASLRLAIRGANVMDTVAMDTVPEGRVKLGLGREAT